MSTKVVTGKCRASFAHLWEPQASLDGGDPKYSVSLLIPKSDAKTISAIKAAMQEAADNFRRKNGNASLPANPRTVLYDGDGTRANGDPFGPECKGHYVLSVGSKDKPLLIDAAKNPILEKSEVYSGMYCRVSMNFFGYNSHGNKGISAGLLAVQKIADGEPFGTVGSADDFDDLEEDESWM